MAAISARVFLLLFLPSPLFSFPAIFSRRPVITFARLRVSAATYILPRRPHGDGEWSNDEGDRWREERFDRIERKKKAFLLFIPLTSLQISPHPSRISATFVPGKKSNLRPLSFSTRFPFLLVPFFFFFFFFSFLRIGARGNLRYFFRATVNEGEQHPPEEER